VDVGSFSDVIPEVRKEIDMATAINDVTLVENLTSMTISP
jgi:hypothetical protein